MLTYQDFLEVKESDRADFIIKAINQHKSSELYRTAVEADLYDHQRNKTINDFVKVIFDTLGRSFEDFTVSNYKIASNLFRRLNTQRCMYSLGNGISFANDTIKEKLGKDFDTRLKQAAYYGLIHGVCFGFWNLDQLYVFPVTEFVPFADEYDGTIKAGIRFWQLADNKPLTAILYELDGFSRYEMPPKTKTLQMIKPKTAYKQTIAFNDAGNEDVIGVENYSSLPIVPLWGSELHQSTLIGMKSAIDSYDIIRSGFANDLNDCSEIYWLIKNAGGMNQNDLNKFMQRLKLFHVAQVDGETVSVEPATMGLPYTARKEYLELIKAGIYEDFGGLDVHTISAGATNDHIDAAYQPMDENADDFEYQIIEFVQQILKLQGIEGEVPSFKRNRISNQYEQVQMLAMEAQWLDERTIIKNLPNIPIDEVDEIMERKQQEEISLFNADLGGSDNENAQE